MIRKGLIIVICLMLALFSFSTATAAETETVTTITCIPGSLLSEYDVFNQICETAAIRIHYLSDGYGALVLALDDTDVLNNLIRVDENGLYLQSDLLGTSVHYFSWEDLITLYTEQIENSDEMQSFTQMMDSPMFQMMLNGSVNEDMDEADAYAMMGIDEETICYFNDLENSKTIETGTFYFQSIVADQKTVMVLTGDDLVDILNLPFMREQIASIEKMSSDGLTDEEVYALADDDLADMRSEFEEINLTLTMTTYTKDNAFVAFDMTIDGDDGYEAAAINLSVTKATIGDAAFYQLNVSIAEDNEIMHSEYGELYLGNDFIAGKYSMNAYADDPILSTTFNCDLTKADSVSGEFTATLYEEYFDEQIAIMLLFDQTRNGDVSDTAIDLFAGASVDGIKSALSDASVISLYFHTVVQPDSGYFAALQSATPETSIQLTQMSDEELEEYSAGLEQTMMMSLYTIIENLPPDLSTALSEEIYGY
ncbi:MAG TPA: hypothetical protein PK537_03575 [Candidatus Limiplasma sp.]|nr:hypothetical protein [Candidatus Limiplasma sp.]